MDKVFEFRKSRLDKLYESMTPIRNLAIDVNAKWNEIVEAFKAGTKIIDLSVEMFDFEVIGADEIRLLIGDKKAGEVFFTVWHSDAKNIEWGDFVIYEDEE